MTTVESPRPPTNSDALVDEAVPAPVTFEHTERTVRKQLTAAMAVPENGEAPQLTPDALVGMILKHARTPGSGEPPPPPPPSSGKTFLGFSIKNWVGYAVKGLFAACVFLFLWYNSVNDGLANKPTHQQAAEKAKAIVDVHADYGKHNDHGEAERHREKLEAHGKQLKALGDIQIRQTIILESHAKDIEENRKDIKSHGNRHNRNQ